MSTLQSSASCLAGLDPADRSPELEQQLAADLLVEAAGFPVVWLASDAERAQRLADVLPRAVSLPAFRDVGTWSPEQLAAIERAGVLVALTTAGQLLPRTLAAALIHAARSDVPVALLVDGLDRVREPEAVAAGVPRQLDEVLAEGVGAGRTRLPERDIVCLGNARVAGPDLAQAVVRGVALHHPGTRSRALARLRAAEARLWIEVKLQHVTALASLSAEHAGLIRESQLGVDVLARRHVGAWIQPLSSIGAALAKLDPEAMVARVYEDARATPLAEAFAARLREEMGSAVALPTHEVEAHLRADLNELRRLVLADLGRLDEAFVARFPGSLPPQSAPLASDALLARVAARLDAIAEEVNAAVLEPALLRVFSELLRGGSSAANQPGSEDARAPSPDAQAPLTRSIFARIPEQMLRIHLVTATRQILDDARDRVEQVLRTALLGWCSEIAELTAVGFRDRADTLAALRAHAARRLASLGAAHTELR
ncbi:MAG: hypothetical protein V4850_17720 [Myxococcota bacterium]